MHTLCLDTTKRAEMIDITSRVGKIVKDSEIKDGLCVIFCPHTTAGLTINENADPSVKKDILTHLEELVPQDKNYTHTEGNSAAHIKSSLVGSSLYVIVECGALVLGTWQGVYLCEFDGPRQRHIYVQTIAAQ
ncbi:MAG: secondary thiamine-phosphate synthase enzyme YjbQ [Candidatus Omnitrophota bacterium]